MTEVPQDDVLRFFGRPYGTLRFCYSKPSTSVLGYFRPSLRDWFVSGFEGGCWLKRSYRDWFVSGFEGGRWLKRSYRDWFVSRWRTPPVPA